MDTELYMYEALRLAREAYDDCEVPVGCVIVDESGNMIGRGRNRRENSGLATAHAEVEAIEEACRKKGGWRLDGCSLYVTLEPCPMCAGAIINSRISRVYYGAREPLSGSCGSVINLFMERYGHEPQIVGGVMGEECAELMRRFFREKR
ncbi:MAG: nucleoside deaminase [Oscillospiraceae bacterium]|nr:nucleoside deaminase [Oscillospiraceae bacterium]